MTQQAEQAIIGSLLMEPQSVSKIMRTLKPEMFSVAMYRKAYELFVAGYENGKSVNEITLVADIAKSDFDAEIITVELGKCFEIRCFPSELESYAESLVKGYTSDRLKNLISINPNPGDAAEQLSMLIQDLEQLRGDTAEQDGQSFDQIIRGCTGMYFNPNREPGLSLGFHQLDELIRGIEPGDVCLIGARPAVGKSSFAAQVTNNIAKAGKKVALFNLEMKEAQIYERFLAYESGISLTRIRQALCYLGDEERKVREANERLRKLPITVYSGSRSISSLRAECRRNKFDVIVVDYLQLLEADDMYKGDRYAEVSSISGELKRLAMDLNIPVIALSQLHRGSEKTAEKEPTMSDLRETGNLEQDASVIVLMWNRDPEDKSLKGCKVEKNRQGMTGTVNMKFNGSFMRFEEEPKEQKNSNYWRSKAEEKKSGRYGNVRHERSEEEPQFTF